MSQKLLLGIGLFGLVLSVMLLAPAAPVADAGVMIPIFDDEDLLAFSIVQDNVYVVPPSQLQTLEQTYGVSGSITTLGNVIGLAPAATSSNQFVMHGCAAGGGALTLLTNKGYGTSAQVGSSFPGATDDTVYTD